MLHGRFLHGTDGALMCLRMLEVQQFMLHRRGKVFVTIPCRIDSLIAFLKVPFAIHTNLTRIEVRFSVCPAKFVVDHNSRGYSFGECFRFMCLQAVLPHVLHLLRFSSCSPFAPCTGVGLMCAAPFRLRRFMTMPSSPFEGCAAFRFMCFISLRTSPLWPPLCAMSKSPGLCCCAILVVAYECC